MTYSVSYKKANDWFWTTVKNVKGDLIDSEHDLRILILDDESRVELGNYKDYQFKFSRERFLVIKQNMEKEAGQILPVSS